MDTRTNPIVRCFSYQKCTPLCNLLSHRGELIWTQLRINKLCVYQNMCSMMTKRNDYESIKKNVYNCILFSNELIYPEKFRIYLICFSLSLVAARVLPIRFHRLNPYLMFHSYLSLQSNFVTIEPYPFFLSLGKCS